MISQYMRKTTSILAVKTLQLQKNLFESALDLQQDFLTIVRALFVYGHHNFQTSLLGSFFNVDSGNEVRISIDAGQEREGAA